MKKMGKMGVEDFRKEIGAFNEKYTYELHAKTLADKLREIRSVGLADNDRITEHLNRSRSPMRKHIEYAYQCYPTDWIEKSINRGRLTPKKMQRGYYSDFYREIAISGWDEGSYVATSFHELGHRFEKAVAEILQEEKAFYNRRTAGEQLQWLGKGYARSEKTRFDKFVDKYMGKDYGGNAYELVSMGFEYAYTRPEELAKDPEMQKWILGILAIL